MSASTTTDISAGLGLTGSASRRTLLRAGLASAAGIGLGAIGIASATPASAATSAPLYPYLFSGYMDYWKYKTPAQRYFSGINGDCTNLFYGSVKNIQRRVGVTQDGNFGSITEAAVKRFQSSNGLKADGIVGKLTAGKMGLLVIWA